jgi:hypothetical protein
MGTWLLLFLSLTAAAAEPTYSWQDVRNAECSVACRRDNHDSGQFINKTAKEPALCACIDLYSYERLTRKRLTLPSRPREKDENNGLDLNFGPSKWSVPQSD